MHSNSKFYLKIPTTGNGTTCNLLDGGCGGRGMWAWQNVSSFMSKLGHRKHLKDCFPPSLKWELCNFQKSKMKIKPLRDSHALYASVFLSPNTGLPHKRLLKILRQASIFQPVSMVSRQHAPHEQGLCCVQISAGSLQVRVSPL